MTVQLNERYRSSRRLNRHNSVGSLDRLSDSLLELRSLRRKKS